MSHTNWICDIFKNRGQTLDNTWIFHYNIWAIGVWRSLVSRLVRVQEASGSNPDTPTMRSVLIGFDNPLRTLRFFIV